jgi:hypothetical protein
MGLCSEKLILSGIFSIATNDFTIPSMHLNSDCFHFPGRNPCPATSLTNIIKFYIDKGVCILFCWTGGQENEEMKNEEGK